MSDRPILFSGAMVRALLDDRKTQTRRVLSRPRWADPAAEIEVDERGRPLIICNSTGCLSGIPLRFAKGDRLWVRETAWYDPKICNGLTGLRCFFEGTDVRHQFAAPTATAPFASTAELLDVGGCVKKRPGIHMPRWASRLTLTVTDVRVQRLTDIDEIDAMAEGIIRHDPTETDDAEYMAVEGGDIYSNAIEAYESLWNRINGALAWKANPWIVAVTFTVEKRNIDA